MTTESDEERRYARVRAALRSLAANYRWSWHGPTQQLFKKADDAGFQLARRNPWAWLRRAGDTDAVRRIEERGLAEELFALEADLQAELDAPAAEGPSVAWFCLEYGLHESLPLYAGGLGVLAGDYLKAASDLRQDTVAVGLLYPEGYVSQRVNRQGGQSLDPDYLDRKDHPLVRLPQRVAVGMPGAPILADVYELAVGRSRLFLLDPDIEDNQDRALREVCRRLYAGQGLQRIRQQLLLGVGGTRLLARLGLLDNRVLHLNESYCAFALVEALRHAGLQTRDWQRALEGVRARSLLTIHTPSGPGHDRFDASTAGEHLNAAFDGDTEFSRWVERHARDDGMAGDDFCMSTLAQTLSGRQNAVSRIHCEVSRVAWDIPSLEFVNDGVHRASWLAPALGDADVDLHRVRNQLRRRLVAFTRSRLLQLPPDRRTGTPETLDENALTIGFARRFAPYKRATLLLQGAERLVRLLEDDERPVQIIFAGKAHPADRMGLELLRRVVSAARSERYRERIHFIPNYDLRVGRMLVQGCDVWLNTPRRPQEASGTSGQKAGLNGSLNLSVGDGWWAEAYNGRNGWLIGAGVDPKSPEQDSQDVDSLFDLLEQEIVPTFYDRGPDGRSEGWLRMVRESMATIGATCSAARMLREYQDRYYAAC